MPLLTVVIATYNRCQLLPRVLSGLLDQKINGDFDFEVLVVDNNSSDKTRQAVELFMPSFNGKLRYLLEPQKGKAFAVNRAVKEAKGDIFVFTDDDVVLDKDWLFNIVECFKQFDCDGLGGRILPGYPPETPLWIKENADLLLGPIVFYDYGEDVKPYQKPMFEFLGANYAFKKSLFEQYGCLHTHIGPGRGTLGEDTELVSRFLKAGKKLYYCGKAVVLHPVDKKRMNLSYIGCWFVGLGRYRFICDEQGKLDYSLVFWFGVPRYLIGQMAKNILNMMANIFNKRKLLAAWIDLCLDWGKATEMRKVYVHQHHHNHL